MAKKRYYTTRLVNHDGKDYPEGSQIILDGEHADPLRAVGAITATKPGSNDADVDDESEGDGEGIES